MSSHSFCTRETELPQFLNGSPHRKHEENYSAYKSFFPLMGCSVVMASSSLHDRVYSYNLGVLASFLHTSETIKYLYAINL